MTARRARGFSLLEVMIAMSILAGALTWITVGVARNIKSENHAKLITSATFLARHKMNDVEDDLYEKGFSDFEKELSGPFPERGFERFSWKVVVDKIELPTSEQVQSIMGKANDAKAALTGDQTPPSTPTTPESQSPMTAGIATMSSQYGLIKDVLESGIRRVTVQVLWMEGSRAQDVTVVTYYTDPRRVDQAVGGLAQLGAAASAAGGGTSSNGATTPSTGPSAAKPGATK